MVGRLRRVLESDPDVAYALLFGSRARGEEHTHSDLDVAVAWTGGHRAGAQEIGGLTSRLETAAGTRVHVVPIDEAPPGLAYRVFRDGLELLVRDRTALATRRARAILEYLDFQPV